MTSSTRFGVSPQEADWYFAAVIDVHGETDYIDGYAAGDEPTQDGFLADRRCRHTWVAGMCYVHDEDVESVAAVRHVECEKCETSYADRDRPRYDVLEWECQATPHGAHARADR